MEDERIVELFWERSEDAIKETSEKYGSYLTSISYSILSNIEDAKECVNDTYHDAWNCIPPHRPSILSSFLGKITRRISISKWRWLHAEKRGGSEMILALEELTECVSGTGTVEGEIHRKELAALLNGFLGNLSETERNIFLRRYWYLDSISAIAKQYGFSESKVTSMLHRIRKKLHALLAKEGY